MAASLFFINPIHARMKIDKGVKTGITLSQLTGDIGNGAESSPKIGALFGGFLALHINEKLGIQTELLLITKGHHRDISMPVFSTNIEFHETAKLTYLEIPILLQLPFPNHKARPSLFLGPAIGIGLSGKNKGSYTAPGSSLFNDGSFDADMGNLKRLDFSLIIGGSLGFGDAGRYIVDIRYAHSLNNAFSSIGDMNSIPEGEVPLLDLEKGEALSVQNDMFSISVGVRLGQK